MALSSWDTAALDQGDAFFAEQLSNEVLRQTTRPGEAQEPVLTKALRSQE